MGMRKISSMIPIIEWLAGYQADWLRFDLMAGLITAAVIIPKAMAYAAVAGLPVEVGLYTAFVPVLIYAVLGSSRSLQCEYYHDPRHPDRGRTQPGCAQRQSR